MDADEKTRADAGVERGDRGAGAEEKDSLRGSPGRSEIGGKSLGGRGGSGRTSDSGSTTRASRTCFPGRTATIPVVSTTRVTTAAHAERGAGLEEADRQLFLAGRVGRTKQLRDGRRPTTAHRARTMAIDRLLLHQAARAGRPGPLHDAVREGAHQREGAGHDRKQSTTSRVARDGTDQTHVSAKTCRLFGFAAFDEIGFVIS